MHLPQLKKYISKSKKYIISFGGINKRSGFSEGELHDSKNLSSDLLPFISQRGERATKEKFNAPTAIFAHNGIAIVDEASFLYKADAESEFVEKATITAGKKQIAQLGDKIIVWPDKMCYNIKENSTETVNADFKFEGLVTIAGTKHEYSEVHENYILIRNVPEKIANIYVPKDRVGNYANDAVQTFSAGDIVTLEKCSLQDRGTDSISIGPVTAEIKQIEQTKKDEIKLCFDDNTFAVTDSCYYVGDQGAILSKKIPDLKFVCEYGGRVWGTDGQTIYASAYNKINQFEKFDGLSSDSYAIEVSTPGEFTGCAAYTNHIVFFKEDSMHRIYGNRPANFNLVTTSAPGVQKGSHNSIRMLNERLFYKGVDGVYMYTGGVPVLISSVLGREKYTDAVAGTYGNKYYISMKNESGEYELFVYDLNTNTFLKEDNMQFVDTAQKDGKLLAIDGDGNLVEISGNTDATGIEWSAELREFNETINEKKGYSKLTMRVDLDEKAYMDVELALDSGRFDKVKTVSRPGKNIVCINVPPNRCDCFRIRLSGKGGCRVQNLVREFIAGGEVW